MGPEHGPQTHARLTCIMLFAIPTTSMGTAAPMRSCVSNGVTTTDLQVTPTTK